MFQGHSKHRQYYPKQNAPLAIQLLEHDDALADQETAMLVIVGRTKIYYFQLCLLKYVKSILIAKRCQTFRRKFKSLESGRNMKYTHSVKEDMINIMGE